MVVDSARTSRHFQAYQAFQTLGVVYTEMQYFSVKREKILLLT
jgi:hypothetical protein